MELVECPHCYTRVIVKADGECPACQKDVTDLQDTDPTRASLAISMSDRMPDICFHCGHDTERTVYVVASRNEDTDSPSTAVAFLTTIASLIFLPVAVFWTTTQQTVEVSLHLPQCQRCAGNMGKPMPDFVNLHKDSMTFIVDKGFKQAVLQLREQRSHQP